MEDAPEEDLELQEAKNKWKIEFLKKGGFGQLYKALVSY